MQRAEADRPDALPLVRQLQRFAQPSLLLQLGGRALRLRTLFRLCRQVLHRLSQRNSLQNPGSTPPLGVAIPLAHTGRADPLVLPKLPAGEDHRDAIGSWLDVGDLPTVPPQPPRFAELRPALWPGCGHESGLITGRAHAEQDTPRRLTHCDAVYAGRGSALPG